MGQRPTTLTLPLVGVSQREARETAKRFSRPVAQLPSQSRLPPCQLSRRESQVSPPPLGGAGAQWAPFSAWSPLPRRSVMDAAHWAASPEPAGETSRTLLASRGPFQKEACGPRPRILWPIVPQNSPRCKQTRPALTVGRIPLRRDERAPPSAEGPAPIQNLYSKPHKIHRP